MDKNSLAQKLKNRNAHNLLSMIERQLSDDTRANNSGRNVHRFKGSQEKIIQNREFLKRGGYDQLTFEEFKEKKPSVYLSCLSIIHRCQQYSISFDEPGRILKLKRALQNTTNNREYRIIQAYIEASQ